MLQIVQILESKLKGALMIIFNVTMEALADKRRELEQCVRSMLPRIRQRAGCSELRWFQDMEHDRTSLFSVWQNRESLEDYLLSDQFAALLGTKILLIAPHSIQIYTVSSQEGNEAVEAVRFSIKHIE
jgi:quinol monooxygenase YgiN